MKQKRFRRFFKLFKQVKLAFKHWNEVAQSLYKRKCFFYLQKVRVQIFDLNPSVIRYKLLRSKRYTKKVLYMWVFIISCVLATYYVILSWVICNNRLESKIRRFANCRKILENRKIESWIFVTFPLHSPFTTLGKCQAQASQFT